jgi:peptide/nickel transport system substrate-binding protein
MIARRRIPVLFLLLVAACSPRPDKGPVVVSAIGGRPSFPDINKRPADTTQRLLLDATAQGLVRFDAGGQIEPALAERWIVIDQGRTYIFRLREAEWSNGGKVTAPDVAIILKRAIAPQSRNPLKPFLTAIDDIVAMTDQVIEVRLNHPQPDLLKLFAQPELAVHRENPPGGSGPFRIVSAGGGTVMLRPAFDPARSPDEDVAEPGPEQNVQLVSESAARAVLRFTRKKSDLVTGGAIGDWPLMTMVKPAPVNIRIDPAAGLFGLAIVERNGLLASAAGRAAIAEAIDRKAVIAAFTPDWGPPVERLLPDKLDSAATPAVSAWTALTPEARLADARRQVAAYRAANPGEVALRVALPDSPGANVLWGLIGSRLATVGVRPIRVAIDAKADLRLVDEVAPYDSARWYLATACVACSDEAQAALSAARDAATLADRARQIAAADAALAADIAFIPIATPLRWSLVSLRLQQWQGNSRAWHPLNRLRNDTN